jgi:hypothetical protein
MTFRLALRALTSRPVRSGVLACGFGFGIAVMAALLGVGEVILDQARAPALRGGGDLLVTGAAGRLESARLIASTVLSSPSLAGRARAVSPTFGARLYLVRANGTLPLDVRGGIPSLERAIADPETARIDAWVDAPADRSWSSPDPADVLRAMDRFHPIPEGSSRASSWAEWLYFNGRARDVKLYLTFFFGPHDERGDRLAGVRLQLDRGGRITTYTDVAHVPEAALLSSAPDVDIGRCRVRLEGLRYRMPLSFPGLTGEVTLEADPGRSLAPVALRGAESWVTGYVVPVLSGKLTGSLRVGDEDVSLDGGTGYHDHNWGFWEGVSWQWGQVAGEGISIVYGRVRPPADVADPARVPGFLSVLGPDGPEGFSTDVAIAETDEPELGRPRRIVVEARGEAVELRMEFEADGAVRTPWSPGAAGPSLDALSLIQLRGVYRVDGRVAGRDVSFSAAGSAETFR